MAPIVRTRKPKESKRECTPEHQIIASGSSSSKVMSTPHSKGTMGASKEKLDGTVIGHIGPTEEDLVTTVPVPFPAMIETLLRREYEIREYTKIDVQDLTEDDRKKKKQDVHEMSAVVAREAFDIFLGEGVAFCNGTNNASMGFKKHIKHMLAQKTERERYEPLVNGINSVLSHFCGAKIGTAEHTPGSDDLIYMVQDTAYISSKPLTPDAGANSTWRKPDVIGTSLAHIAALSGIKGGTSKPLSYWVEDFQANAEIWSEIRRHKKSTWKDCWNVWELKCEKCVEVGFPYYTVMGVLGHAATLVSEINGSEGKAHPTADSEERPTLPKQADSAPTILGTGKRPRPFDWSNANDEASRKRGKGTSGKGKADSTGRKVPQKAKVTVSPEVQSAYYGIEMLRSRWDKLHSMVLLLQDNLLSFKWYDPEGCITTERIDIVSQLPLLVVMLTVFQRFDHRMRGIACIETSVSLSTGETAFDIPHNAHAPWQLRGTHTTAAAPVRRGTGVSKPAGAATSHGHYPEKGISSEAHTAIGSKLQSLKDVFFKFSWREETRDPEGVVIATARERARHYLNKEGTSPEWVTDYLPDVKVYLEYETLSTKHIRTGLGLECKESRIPTLMLSRKYQSFSEVQASQFRFVIWQVIRCHSLMWKLGIAHGDITFANLLVKTSDNGAQCAIVNDYDQANIMVPMSLSPSPKGFQRNHTKAFLAQDLMDNANGTIPRLYVHDLESIVWTMTWYVQEHHEWHHGSYDAVAFARQKWARDSRRAGTPNKVELRSGTTDLWMPIVTLAFNWGIAQQTMKDPKPNGEWLGMILDDFGEDKKIGSKWADFEIASGDIREGDTSNACK
ncbi:hypothetical protein BKA70DRAFT_1513450 [Coprinopsis sp. MPI-PUGE-AT-0042]|nr:hypothetical protein BKA70DRAFT_1513450 [Coprinopsis sp. MPI-PUGE-AT-0042]